MIKNKKQISISTENNNSGEIKLYLSDLADFSNRNPKLRTFAHAVLKAGEEVEFVILRPQGNDEYQEIEITVTLADASILQMQLQ